MLKRSALFFLLGFSSAAMHAGAQTPELNPPFTSAPVRSNGAFDRSTPTPSQGPASDQAVADAVDEDALYAQLARETSELERMQRVVKIVSKMVRKSVVHIEASKIELSQGRSEAFDEAGSGVIIRRNNRLWVVTNRHVISGADAREITLRMQDGRTFNPDRVLSDAATDVAILELPRMETSIARLGDSSNVGIGDFVLAVGSPFGLSHSVTFGIVSATGRRDLTLGTERIELQDFFQTDAAINPGNSGGPLLNLRGEVIGLNTAIASSSGGSEGIGFAIPMNMVLQVVDQLIEHGRVHRAYLGVSLSPDFNAAEAVRRGLPTPGGALVKTVRPNSPASSAGIREGDVITQFDGVRIDDDDHLVTRVGLTPVGREVTCVLYRSGQAYSTKVRVAALPSQ